MKTVKPVKPAKSTVYGKTGEEVARDFKSWVSKANDFALMRAAIRLEDCEDEDEFYKKILESVHKNDRDDASIVFVDRVSHIAVIKHVIDAQGNAMYSAAVQDIKTGEWFHSSNHWELVGQAYLDALSTICTPRENVGQFAHFATRMLDGMEPLFHK